MDSWQEGKNPVSFTSDSVTLRGNLFLPPSFDSTRRYPGVVVTGSWTTVKEQMAGLYAERLAQEGFVTLAFDFRHFGESGGEPRQYEAPDEKIEDIRSAAVFLQSLSFVDAARIGGFGICASSGYIVNAAASDARFKALALVAPWLHNAPLVEAIYGGTEGVQQKIATSRTARAQFEAGSETPLIPAASRDDENSAMYAPGDYLDYYLNAARGAIPPWVNRFHVMSWEGWLTFDPVKTAPNIRVPVLMVHSENAAIPDGAKQFFAALQTAKEFYWMPGTQFDFYDQEPNVTKSLNAVATHFQMTL
jgi:fermentation-respiration switch protein FrsA (DUF1100 family)